MIGLRLTSAWITLTLPKRSMVHDHTLLLALDLVYVVVFGFALISVGKDCLLRVVGKLKITMGACFLSLILSPLAVLLIIPVSAMEVVVLYLFSELVKGSQLLVERYSIGTTQNENHFSSFLSL